MKVLWIINVITPEAARLLDLNETPFGGWLVNASQEISQKYMVDLHVAFPHFRKITHIKGNSITYWSFRQGRFFADDKTYRDIIEIVDNVRPDLVHIHGTELSHSYIATKILREKEIPFVVSIQGMVGFISRHYESHLPYNIILKSSFRNIIFQDNINNMKKKFEKRGINERKIIEQSSYVIGRTEWDRATTYQLNPNIKYFHCNEVLRNEFYNKSWEYEKCEKHSIFFSQATYPVKGFHHLIEALPLILKEFPNTVVYVAGPNPLDKSTLKTRLKKHYYDKYLENLIRKHGLEKNIIFTGCLGVNEMVERFLKSHVFVSASSIENSPNSVGEAMILGVPVVSSYVGGVMDMINHKIEGYLYQSDAPYMLAHYICKVFEAKDEVSKMSQNAQKKAHDIYNVNSNINRMFLIYETILSKEETVDI